MADNKNEKTTKPSKPSQNYKIRKGGALTHKGVIYGGGSVVNLQDLPPEILNIHVKNGLIIKA